MGEKIPVYECNCCGHTQTVEEMFFDLTFENGKLIVYFSCKKCEGFEFTKTNDQELKP